MAPASILVVDNERYLAEVVGTELRFEGLYFGVRRWPRATTTSSYRGPFHEHPKGIRRKDGAVVTHNPLVDAPLPIVAAPGRRPHPRTRQRSSGGGRVRVPRRGYKTPDVLADEIAQVAALADSAFTETVITRAFTGRPARALRNGLIERYDATAINAYPPCTIHPDSPAGRRNAGDADRLLLWAGTGYRKISEGHAADVIRSLTGAQTAG